MQNQLFSHSFKGKTHQLSHCLPSKSLLIIASFTKKKNGFLEHILVAVAWRSILNDEGLSLISKKGSCCPSFI